MADQRSLTDIVRKMFGREKSADSKPKYEMLPEPVKVYVSLLPNSQYQPESFEMASRFFREEAGIDMRFEFCKRDEIPYETIDKRLKLAIIEKSVEEDYKKVGINIEVYHDEAIEQLKSGDPRLFKRASKIDYENMKRYLEFEAHQRYEGLSFTEEGKIILLNKPQDADFIRDYKAMKPLLEKSIEADYALLSENSSRMLRISIAEKEKSLKKIDECYNAIIRSQKLTIIHEIGHQASLLHSDSFFEHKLMIRFRRENNIMNKEEKSRNENYGLTAQQISKLRDYFSGGETYRIFKELGFDLEKYLDALQREKGYRENPRSGMIRLG